MKRIRADRRSLGTWRTTARQSRPGMEGAQLRLCQKGDVCASNQDTEGVGRIGSIGSHCQREQARMESPAGSPTAAGGVLRLLRPLRKAMCLLAVVAVASLAVVWHFAGVRVRAASLDSRFEAVHQLSVGPFRSANPYVGFGSTPEITCRTAFPSLHDAVWKINVNVFT